MPRTEASEMKVAWLLGKKFCVMMVWISLFQSLYRLIPIETAKINNPLLTNETGVSDLASLGRWQSQNSTPSVSDPKSYVLAPDARRHKCLAFSIFNQRYPHYSLNPTKPFDSALNLALL